MKGNVFGKKIITREEIIMNYFFRSSLKKSNYAYAPGSNLGRTSPWWGGGSGGGTPTHDRPTPDSSSDEVGFPLSKADSGFVSSGGRLVR